MSEYFNAVYIKEGAVFSSGEEAYADKNSSYPPEFMQTVNDCYSQMLASGVLIEPISYTWEQDTFTLTVVKHISKLDEYLNALTFNPAEATFQSKQAGWIFIPD